VAVTLFEASDRVGGWLKTESKDGFTFERGCRGFRCGVAPALAVSAGTSVERMAM
jgi:protoporphyrinogen oxidase